MSETPEAVLYSVTLEGKIDPDRVPELIYALGQLSTEMAIKLNVGESLQSEKILSEPLKHLQTTQDELGQGLAALKESHVYTVAAEKLLTFEFPKDALITKPELTTEFKKHIPIVTTSAVTKLWNVLIKTAQNNDVTWDILEKNHERALSLEALRRGIFVTNRPETRPSGIKVIHSMIDIGGIGSCSINRLSMVLLEIAKKADLIEEKS